MGPDQTVTTNSSIRPGGARSNRHPGAKSDCQGQAAQARLLDLIPARGGRLTDLALAMRISKQGLGQLATSLAAGGYIEMLPDPGDNRAKIIRRTPIGDELKDGMRSAIANVEQRWRTEVGDERYATLLDALQQLAGTGREPSLPNKPGP